MKNDMKLIMESWRTSEVLLEEPDYARDFVASLDPVQFPDGSIGQFWVEITSIVTGGKNFEDLLKNNMKKMDDQIDAIENRKARSLGKKILNFGLGRGLGYTFSALLAPATGGASFFLAPIFGEVLAGVAEAGVTASIAELDKLKASLNVPDPEVGQYKTAPLWDVNDDLIKIIAGADLELSRKEFRAIAEVYLKITKAIQTIENTIRSKYNNNEYRDILPFLQQPIDTILKWDEGSANAAVQKKFASIINLTDDYVLKKDP